MSEYDSSFRELGWDDEIQGDGNPFQLLPEGDYLFSVAKFERARHNGSEKIPPCNKAVLTLSLRGKQGSGSVQTKLYLHNKFEWKLCQFFIAIGFMKRDEKYRPNWSAVPGASGYCHIDVRKWTGNDGREHESNEVTEFYDPADNPMNPAGAAQKTSEPGAGGYTPGQF